MPLAPTQSALYLVMDQSRVMHGAFGPMGSATALSLSLTDPVFKRTFAAFTFLPGQPADCTAATTPFTTPRIDFALAADVQPQIAAKLAVLGRARRRRGHCRARSSCRRRCGSTRASTST